jgi:hypothetical protein
MLWSSLSLLMMLTECLLVKMPILNCSTRAESRQKEAWQLSFLREEYSTAAKEGIDERASDGMMTNGEQGATVAVLPE